MYRKQTPLTDEEMLILLEGDVSDESETVNTVQQDPGTSATPFIRGLASSSV